MFYAKTNQILVVSYKSTYFSSTMNSVSYNELFVFILVF